MGLFGGRKSRDAEPAASADEEVGEAAVEAVAALLRTLGRHAIALDSTPGDTITRRFEDWARHVLVRSPSPAREATPSSPGVTPPRDWPGLQRYVAEQRRNEAALVAETVTGLREAARSFVRAMSQLRVVGDTSDSDMRQHIERLRLATVASSPLDLKREVLAAADVLDQAVTNRREQEAVVSTGLAEKVKDLSRQLEQARREGALDGLTRLPNRKALDDVLAETVELATVTREPVCLVMADLDDFKDINDGLGHAAGDDALKAFADALTRIVLSQRDMVARFGGDEFCIILRDCTVGSARALVGRVVTAVERLELVRGEARFNIRASFGIAALVPGDRPESLIERADQALYEVKRSGKNAVAVQGL